MLFKVLKKLVKMGEYVEYENARSQYQTPYIYIIGKCVIYEMLDKNNKIFLKIKYSKNGEMRRRCIQCYSVRESIKEIKKIIKEIQRGDNHE